MPQFQASIDLGEMVCPAPGVQAGFSFLDTSNYEENSTPGHTPSDFSYVFIIIERPDGQIYELSTPAAATFNQNVELPLPYVAEIDTIDIPVSFATINGTYSVTMIVIPDWNNETTYSFGGLVIHNGEIWLATAGSTTEEPGEGAEDWQTISRSSILGNPSTYGVYAVTANVEVDCEFDVFTPYATTLLDEDNRLDISIDGNCDIVSITDNSNYEANDQPGHALSDFSQFRQIHILYPNGGSYLLSSTGDGDEEITPASSGNMTINWDMDDNLKDGRFKVHLCSVPTWSGVYLYSTPETIVYHNGQLWRYLQESVNEEPGEESEYWELFEGDLQETKYCFKANFVVTCRVIDLCYREAVIKANCAGMNCCDDSLCDNPVLLKATKLTLIKTELKWAVWDRNWKRVDALINAGLKQCNC